MSKFGSVQVGFDFECEKNNGKRYAGEIVKVAAYAKGTLVTIRFFETDAYRDHTGEWHDVQNPVHKSIYLEDCKVWYSEEPSLI